MPVAVNFMYCNFARKHETIRCAPAMAAGVSKHLWSVEETVGMADEYGGEKGESKLTQCRIPLFLDRPRGRALP